MEEAWQGCLHGSWELRKQLRSSWMVGEQWSAELLLLINLSLYFFFPCFLWPSSLASISGRPGEAWTDIGNGAPTGAYSFTSLRFHSSCCSPFSFVSLSVPSCLRAVPVRAEDFCRSLLPVRWLIFSAATVALPLTESLCLQPSSAAFWTVSCWFWNMLLWFARVYLCPRSMPVTLFVLPNLQSCTVWSTCKGRDEYCHIVGQFWTENSTSWKQSTERTFYFCMVATGIADVCLDPHRGYTLFSKAYANPQQWSMAGTFECAPLWAVAAPGIYSVCCFNLVNDFYPILLKRCINICDTKQIHYR